MAVQLKFNSMDDFEPARVVEQVEPLRKLLETRDKLRDLLTQGRPLRGIWRACSSRSCKNDRRHSRSCPSELGVGARMGQEEGGDQ